jgi:hypothetical protein
VPFDLLGKDLTEPIVRQYRPLETLRQRADDRAGAGALALVALIHEPFKQSAHAVEIGDSLLDQGQLVLRKLAGLAAVLPVLEEQQSSDFFKSEAQLLRPFDEPQARDCRIPVASDGAGASLRLRYQAQALVIADGFLVDSGLLGNLPDGELVQMDLLVSLTL